MCLNELSFIRNCGAPSHHCGFYTKVQWPFLVILETFQFYSSSFLILKNGAYSLSSRDVYSYFTLPKVKTEMGRRAFRFSAPTTWNVLQLDHKLHNLALPNVFRSMINPIKFRPHMCICFI